MTAGCYARFLEMLPQHKLHKHLRNCRLLNAIRVERDFARFRVRPFLWCTAEPHSKHQAPHTFNNGCDQLLLRGHSRIKCIHPVA